MNELEQRVQKSIAKLPRQPRNSEEEYYWRCSVAQAALKAHAEFLEEQRLVVVPRETLRPFCEGQVEALGKAINKKLRGFALLSVSVTKDQFKALRAALQQEE